MCRSKCRKLQKSDKRNQRSKFTERQSVFTDCEFPSVWSTDSIHPWWECQQAGLQIPTNWIYSTNRKAWKKKNKVRGLTLPSFKTSCGTAGIENPWIGKAEDVHVWQQNTEPRNSPPWSTHEKHSTKHQFSSKLSRSSKQGRSERLRSQEEP